MRRYSGTLKITRKAKRQIVFLKVRGDDRRPARSPCTPTFGVTCLSANRAAVAADAATPSASSSRRSRRSSGSARAVRVLAVTHGPSVGPGVFADAVPDGGARARRVAGAARRPGRLRAPMR